MELETSLKEYRVTVNFQIKGYLPYMIEEEHIKGKIEDLLHDTIALHGEYYGDYDEEWEMYPSGKINVELSEFSITYTEQPFCEHCGERHSDYGVEIHDGGTSWCLNCWLSGNEMTDEEIEEIQEKEREGKKEYYQKQLDTLNKKIKEL